MRSVRTIDAALDAFAIFVSFFIALWAYQQEVHLPSLQPGASSYVQAGLSCFCSLGFARAAFGESPTRRGRRAIRQLVTVFKINVIGFLVLSCLIFILKMTAMSRLFSVEYFVVSFFFMLSGRYVVRLVLNALHKSGLHVRSRIIVGSGQSAQHYLQEIHLNGWMGIRIAGYVADERVALGIPYLGGMADIHKILIAHAPDQVVVALGISDPYVRDVIRACEQQGVSIEFLLDGLSQQFSSSEIYHGRLLSSVQLSATPHTPASLILKRLTDILGSVIALALLSPLFLIVAMAIKLEDRGPIIFKQIRVGQHNRHFAMYKFRSMRVDAEQLKESLMHLNEMSGPVFKIRDDPRVTRIGRLLRASSIDEIPQFVNVLLGHMSLVGPRPPLPSEVNKYATFHRRRLSVKPGLTCLWQVSGRNQLDFDQWVHLDLDYIDSWSYMSDLKILAQTIPAVLKRNGAS